MTGLDKIITQIEDDANAAADAILKEGELRAAEIIAAAEEEASKKQNEILSKAELDVEQMKKRAESAAALRERKRILDAKQQIIRDMIDKAEESILTLSDEAYFELILKMVGKYSLPEGGYILFSAKDKERLPLLFENSLSQAISKKDGASLTISEDLRNMRGGFILIYGEIEVNCSFEALFSATKDILQDKVASLLFE